MTIVVEKGAGAGRSVTEIGEIIGRKKRPGSKTNKVYHTPNKGIHYAFSLQKTPFSPKRTGAKDRWGYRFPRKSRQMMDLHQDPPGHPFPFQRNAIMGS
jgi:hypothetical protein